MGKPEFTECPKPPLELKEWLENGWSKFDKEVNIKKSISKIEKDSGTGEEKLVKINFDDDKKRISALENWKDKIDDAIINGTGVVMPLGILNSSALVSVFNK